MGIYSKTSMASANDVLDANIENITEFNYEPTLAGGLTMVAENEANFNAIMKAVGIMELSHLEEHGTEMVYEAADFTSFFNKIKEFFKKMWEKIKQVFAKFVAVIDSYTKSDKAFVSKYTTAVLKGSTKDLNYKGYNFKVDWSMAGGKATDLGAVDVSAADADALTDANVTKLLDVVAKGDADTKEDLADKMRGKALGQTSIASDEFTKEVHMYFRDGEDSKIELSNINARDQLNLIENTKAARTTAEKAFKDLKKAIEDQIKALDKAEKSLNSAIKTAKSDTAEVTVDGDKTYNMVSFITLRQKAYTIGSDSAKTALGINITVYNAQLQAIKDRNRQAKSICIALMGRKDPDAKNESTGFNHYTEGSFLDSVTLK